MMPGGAQQSPALVLFLAQALRALHLRLVARTPLPPRKKLQLMLRGWRPLRKRRMQSVMRRGAQPSLVRVHCWALALQAPHSLLAPPMRLPPHQTPQLTPMPHGRPQLLPRQRMRSKVQHAVLQSLAPAPCLAPALQAPRLLLAASWLPPRKFLQVTMPRPRRVRSVMRTGAPRSPALAPCLVPALQARRLLLATAGLAPRKQERP
jgi:hypothetical protein